MSEPKSHTIHYPVTQRKQAANVNHLLAIAIYKPTAQTGLGEDKKGLHQPHGRGIEVETSPGRREPKKDCVLLLPLTPSSSWLLFLGSRPGILFACEPPPPHYQITQRLSTGAPLTRTHTHTHVHTHTRTHISPSRPAISWDRSTGFWLGMVLLYWCVLQQAALVHLSHSLHHHHHHHH